MTVRSLAELRWPRWVLFSAAGAVASLSALPLAGSAAYPLAAGEIRLQARPAWGGLTSISIPPLGSVEAITHSAPLRLTISPEAIDVPNFERLLEIRPTTEQIVAGLRDERDRALLAFGVRMALVGGLAGMIAFGLLRGKRAGDALLAAGTGILLPAALYAASLSQFDPNAFRNPTLTGALTRAPEIVGPVEELTQKFESFRQQLGAIGSTAFRIYRFLEEQSIVPSDSIRILHIGDIHLNPVGYDVAIQVARQFRVDAVVDTGDITAQGTEVEASFVDRIRDFRVPYIFVRGNHDSLATENAVRGEPNAIVLDMEETAIEGLVFFGAADPLFTPGRSEELSIDRQNQEKRRFSHEIVKALDRMSVPIHLLLVHDPVMADEAAGQVPLVLAGHGHRWNSRERDGTLLLQVASTGAAGIQSFSPDSNEPIALQVLYFDRRDLRLVAFDRIEIRGPRQEFLIRRTTLEDTEDPSESQDSEAIGRTTQPAWEAAIAAL